MYIKLIQLKGHVHLKKSILLSLNTHLSLKICFKRMFYHIRYYPRPMSLNILGNLIKEASVKAGLGKRVTYSMRKTTVTTLSRTGVSTQKIMKITGHNNIQSITHYDAEL